MRPNTISSATFLLSALLLVGTASCANILAIFPHPGESHFMNVKPFFAELVRRGHNLTVISFFPLKAHERLANYHDISLEGCLEMQNNNVSFSNFESTGISSVFSQTIKNLISLYFLSEESVNAVFKAPPLTRFVDQVLKGHNFDLAIIETFQTDLFLGLVYRLQVPFISVSTCNLFTWSSNRIAAPQNPSYIPTNIDVYDDHMTLSERLKNTISFILMHLSHAFLFAPRDQALANKHFGPLPPLSEIAKNTSLLLANIHFSMNKPRPLVPQLIEVGGLHIGPAKPLPKELSQFLNSSSQGVIYFCMGSLLRGETFPPAKRQAFLDAFSELPYNVLWKYEGKMPGQPKNVKISAWTPQRDILSHPNVKLFITHGGLLGATEAVYEGIPMLAIPMFGDQNINMRAIQSQGAGLILDYQSLNKEKILNGIRTVMQPKFKASARRMQTQYRDRPMSAMETAIFWTEYVIRHKGAAHLRTGAVHLAWYQYLCLDVLLILALSLVTLLVGLKLFLSYLVSKLGLGQLNCDTKNKRD